MSNSKQDRLIAKVSRLWNDQQARTSIAKAIQTLDARYDLNKKMVGEPGVEEIIVQMFGRLANSYKTLSDIQGKKILDIACGSNTSKAPASLYVNTPFGEKTIRRAREGFTAQFEPWFCRILLELEADPVGIDFGDLDREFFAHYRVDLGQTGALDFLPDHSFDAVQDSRLFGSPEFTSQFPNQADRLKIAQEIKRQEQRVLKSDGVVIHSDADALLK
ncbi:MAG: hypothetical protein WBW94_00760 [Anaerolineales bacterium]